MAKVKPKKQPGKLTTPIVKITDIISGEVGVFDLMELQGAVANSDGAITIFLKGGNQATIGGDELEWETELELEE